VLLQQLKHRDAVGDIKRKHAARRLEPVARRKAPGKCLSEALNRSTGSAKLQKTADLRQHHLETGTGIGIPAV
jgi:hypothetical protein